MLLQEVQPIMRSTTLTVLLSISMLLCFGSCQRKENGSGGKTIGVSLLTRAHIFYRDLEQGLRDEASKRGYTLIITTAEFDLSKQTAQIEDFIARKVDAIVICPVDSRGIGAGIKKANDAGIPVFTADIAAQEGDVVAHIASDNVAGGKLAGEYLARSLKERGSVAVINQPAITSVLDRVQGFRAAIAKYPGITLVADANGEGVRDKAMQAAADVLQAHPDLRGIFGINDDSALGALDAVQQFKRSGVVIVGYDATPPAVDAIRRGSALKADVIQHPHLIGVTTVQNIAAYFTGETIPKIVPVEVGIVDQQTLAKAENTPEVH
jgi:ribose transport system substrate-binding protein